MPQIKLNKVQQCSSEDVANNNIANNLLRTNDYKSWKSKSWDSLSFVIFELSEPTLIDSLEIGNDCSAFVEVLVSNTNQMKPRFQVLLSTSSFMTPSESHSLNNCNRVRNFTKDKLSPNSVAQKWDLIKCVCTQPFNKTISYGLSFIRLNSPSNDNDEEPEVTTTSLNIGPFRLRNEEEEESESPNLSAGSLFAKRSNNSSNLSSDVSKRSSLASAVGLMPKTRNHQNKPPIDSSPSLTPKQSSSQTNESKSHQKRVSSESHLSRNPSTNISFPQRTGSSPPKKPRKIKDKPFNQLMAKVNFVLSGFVNPKRRQLRDMASEMGAKYCGDWNRNCTHLVCAFANTPKFNDVKSKCGRIVKEKWIEDCYAHKKLLPWRSYMLGSYSGPDSPDVSEEEEEETINTNNNNNVQYFDEDEEEMPASQPTSDALNEALDNSERMEVIGFCSNNNNNCKDIDIDKSDDIYDAETDSESNAETMNTSKQTVSQKSPSMISKDLFINKCFHFYGPFDENEKQTLTQYIISYKGKLEENLTPNVKYVITNSNWNQHFEEACAMNESLVFVKPKWIYRCHENSKLVAYQPFVISCNFD